MKIHILRISFMVIITLALLPGNSLSQECNIIYVTPTGISSGAAGTRSNPASLTYGLSLATPTDNQIWLASGNYSISTTLFMISDVTVEGGFDPVTWIKTNLQPSVIYRDNSNMQTLPNRLVAVECTGISNFRLQDLTIVVANGSGDGASVYGIHLDGCSNYSITRCIITTGNATDGLPGGPGIGGISGANGTPGQGGDGNGSCCTAGGAGGSGSFPGSFAGGTGGAGGARGTGTALCFGSGNTAPDGLDGLTGQGPGGGAFGTGGAGYCQPACISFGCDAGFANAGTNGQDGLDGANGLDGVVGTPGFGNYFINGDGVIGQQGVHGGGGGGGGGGGSQGCMWSLFWNNNGAGAGGGGGGEGGQGGFGATGGTGGGGSFPIYIFNNQTGTEVKDCNLSSGLQGLGGLGGIPGGLGGAGGGNGCPCVSSDCDLGDPGDGGFGGTGGMGGNGGNGSPGVSFPLYEDPLGLAAAQSDMRSQVEPQIFVKNTGCTWSDIEFYTNATGIIIWYFDGGALPLSATGDSVVIQYSSMGRHSITLIVDGVPYIFTDFVGIFSDGFIPNIVSADSITCPGTSATFTSSITNATYYDWVVYDNPPVSFSGSGTISINHTFSDTGTYEITLQTTSICCGRSKIDTFEVIVAPLLAPIVYVSVTSASICAGDQTTFGAVPINGGTNPTYQWLVNGSPAGSNTNTFVTSSLADGDIVTCFMISNYTCAVPIDATSLPITIEVNPLPVVTCTVDKVYLGAFTNFDATVSTGTAPFTYDWEFGDGGIDTGATVSNYYGSTGSYSYTVTVTDSNGCVGICSDVLQIIIAPFVDAGYTSNIIQACDNATVTFVDTSIGNPDIWFWDFGDGVTIGPGSGVISGMPNTSGTYDNPTHVFTTPGTYNVTLGASNGVYTDSALYPNIVVVRPSPIAGLISSDTSGCTSINTQFFDASLGAWWFLWDFDDATSSTQQNPEHSYAGIGTYNVTVTVWTIDSFCSDAATISINVYETPFADFERDTACSSLPIQFTNLSFATGNSTITSYEWDFGDGTDSITDVDPSHVFDPGGTYYTSMIVTSNFGCRDTAFDTILIYTKPEALFSAEPDVVTILNPEITFTDETISDSLATWNWQFGDGDSSIVQNPVHEYPDTGLYSVLLTVTDTNGCLDTISHFIEITPDYIFFLPNTFTPNKDGINEIFIPQSVGLNVAGYHFYIFNRWGDVLFHTEDITVGWKGMANKGKKLAQTGVYVWLVLSKDLTGANHQYTGHVTLIR